jgi:hypothetical protein
MIISRIKDDRDKTVSWIVNTCFGSLDDRRALYDRRKRFFLFGSYSDMTVRYNRLRAHMDLVASFLYAADGAKFSVSAPRNSEDVVVKQFMSIQDSWNDDFRDSGIAYQYSDTLLWSLVFDSMFIKMGWNSEKDELFAQIVPPYHFGVFRDDIPDLDSQEAFCHRYSIDYDNAVQRLVRAGRSSDIPKLSIQSQVDENNLPPILANLIINATGGPNLSGNILGQANLDYEPTATYEAKVDAPVVDITECYVWDDDTEDYILFEMISPDIVISDSREVVDAMRKAKSNGEKLMPKTSANLYLPGEHPFVHLCPYKMFNYFWGEAAIDKLINLQKWTNERLDQIADILDRQADPAKVFSGFMGLSDEKAGALGGPGTWVMDQLPNAQVKELVPEMPQDLFAEVTAIGQIFLEASGLTETTTGHGEQGVRSKGHAKQLATTGSARIKKVAVAQEEPLAKIGHLGVKLMMKNDDTVITGDNKMKFVAAQAGDRWHIRIAGHSHSPLFSDEAKETAVLLLKAQAIDGEMLIRLLNPPNADNLIHALKERLAKAPKSPPVGPAGAKGKSKAHEARSQTPS